MLAALSTEPLLATIHEQGIEGWLAAQLSLDVSRYAAGDGAINRAEMITGTPGEQPRRRANDNHSRQTHRSVGG